MLEHVYTYQYRQGCPCSVAGEGQAHRRAFGFFSWSEEVPGRLPISR